MKRRHVFDDTTDAADDVDGRRVDNDVGDETEASLKDVDVLESSSIEDEDVLFVEGQHEVGVGQVEDFAEAQVLVFDAFVEDEKFAATWKFI